MRKLKESENIWVLGIFLGLLGLLSAFALALVSARTAPAIRAAKARETDAAIRKLGLPEFDRCIDCGTIDGVEFRTAVKDGKAVGFVAEASRPGYGGAIRLLVGFDATGGILAVSVLEHKETPGLGAEVCERKFQKTLTRFRNPHPEKLPANPILDQFNGRRAENEAPWRVSRDGGEFACRTGATVTSRAVTEAVEAASRSLGKHRAAILAEAKQETK